MSANTIACLEAAAFFLGTIAIIVVGLILIAKGSPQKNQ